VKTTSLLFHMTEPDGVWPSDAAGNLDDLHTEPGINAPTAVAAWTGQGRRFLRASSQALLGADLADRDTLLQRDVTIQALLSLTLAGAAGPHTLIARGLNDGSISERYCYGLELEEQAGFAGYVEARFFWQDSAGAIKTQPAGVFKHPGDGVEFMLTATRRWEATGKVVCRYYVDHQLIAELVTADGDISGGTTGHVAVGARKAAGAWGRFLNGTIDKLYVDEREMSGEEVRQIWLRLTEHQPAGVQHFSGLVPEGLSWAKNLGNSIGRRVKVAGQALGLVRAAAEEMRALWLPNKAPDPELAEWEGLCGLSIKPGDSLDVRHARMEAYLSRDEGFALPAVRATLQSVLDVNDPDDILIIEYDNITTDNFVVFDTDEKWMLAPSGVWSLGANSIHLAVAGGTDLTWTTVREACHARIPLDTGGGRVYVSAKLSGFNANAADAGVGMFLHNRATNHTLWFGVLNVAGVLKLGWTMRDGFTEGAFHVLATPVVSPLWLRVETVDGAPGSFKFSWSTIGAGAGFTTATAATGALDLQWAGFGAWTAIAGAGASAADFAEFLAYTPDSDRSFAWYAYRDPALAGAPDIDGAHLTVQKLKPAHTYAAAIQRTSVIYDDERDGLYDRGPMGSW
jgi:hypothetical protein